MKMPTSSGQRTLLIGYGNDLRSDDGAGVRAAARLAARLPKSSRSRHTDVIVTQQLTPDLAEDIAAAEQVVFIDAYAADGAGADLRVERVRADGTRASAIGHHGDPACLMRLAGQLFGRVPDAWVVGIPAFSFEAGETISPGTSRGIDEAVALIGGRAFSGKLKGDRQ